MEPIKSKKIVRVRKIINRFNGVTQDVYLTTYAEYLSSTLFVTYLKKIELYPYKWYNLSRFIEVPIFYLLSFFSSEKITILDVKSKSINIAKLIIGIIGFVSSVLGIISFFK